MHELCCCFTAAAGYSERAELYLERYAGERGRIVAAEINPPFPEWSRLVDWAGALEESDLLEERAARRRRPSRGDGSLSRPFQAGNEFSDPAKLDAQNDARDDAVSSEIGRREAELELRIAIALSRSPAGRPSGLALGLGSAVA